MRPPLALAAVLTFTCVRHAAAAAVECNDHSFTPAALKTPCGDSSPKGHAACSAYQDEVIAVCRKEMAAVDAIVGPMVNKKRTPAEEIAYKAASKKFDELWSASIEAQFAGDDAADPTSNSFAAYVVQAPAFVELQKSKPLGDFNIFDDDDDHKKGKKDPSEPPPAGEPAPNKDAVERLEHKALSSPDPAPSRVEKVAEQYLAAGSPSDAARLAKSLMERAPKDARGPTLLARAALSGDKPEEAAQWARKALALDPANKEARDALSFAEASLSKSRLKRPNLKPGFEDAEGVVAGGTGGPRRDDTRGPGGEAGGSAGRSAVVEEVLPTPPHLQLAERTAAAGDLPGALGYLTLALDQNPDDDYARIMRAEISLALKNPDAALADADRVLAKKPDDPRALRAKASALLQLGRIEEALAVIERAIALAPLNAAGHLTRAMILEKLGRAADAAASYREAARLDPALKPVADEALRRLGFAAGGGTGLSLLRGKLTRGALVALSGALLLAVLLGASKRRESTGAPAAAATPRSTGSRPVSTGDLVGGQYRVARELGRGGMGVVFEAVDETLKRSVALKQMNAELLSAEDAARFLQEARLVAQLKHPGIAGILAAVEDGGLFLVFELMDGRPLDKVLSETGVMAPADVRRVIGDLCEALACAHQNRIIHRDLKPSNVMFTKDKRSKIMDFGIAHQARGAAATQTSASGTPPYMAPEQAMGSVLPASDLYALAVMAYELLAGARPFRGPDYLGPKMRGEFDPITRVRPGLPATLDAFFARALAPDPAKRPQDAAGFRGAFDACWDDGLAKTLV